MTASTLPRACRKGPAPRPAPWDSQAHPRPSGAPLSPAPPARGQSPLEPHSRLRLFAPSRQPLVFGAMVHRDEAFETIFSQYMKITSAAAAGSES